MARITVEDCLENVENRFDLVMIAAKRARQIQTGGKDPMVPEDNDKPAVLALREIAAKLVNYSILTDTPREEETESKPVEAKKAENADISIEEAMDAELVAEEPSETTQEEVSPSEDEDED